MMAAAKKPRNHMVWNYFGDVPRGFLRGLSFLRAAVRWPSELNRMDLS